MAEREIAALRERRQEVHNVVAASGGAVMLPYLVDVALAPPEQGNQKLLVLAPDTDELAEYMASNYQGMPWQMEQLAAEVHTSRAVARG